MRRGIQSTDGRRPASGFLPRPRRAALPAAAPEPSFRRRAGARPPTDHRIRRDCVAAAGRPVVHRRHDADRLAVGALSEGPRSQRPVPDRAPAVDRGGAHRSSAHAARRAAVPGSSADSRERPAAVRSRDRFRLQASQFLHRRNPAGRAGLRGRRDGVLALPRAVGGDVVRNARRRRIDALTCG